MRILIVEDDESIVSFVRKGLRENGFTVDVAYDGSEGLFLSCEERYDCIVLDIMLPKMDGITMLKELRSRNITTPVIFLTAKDSVRDRVKGLESGADDYLVKPFVFSELLARIKALLRRGSGVQEENLVEGDLRLDLRKRKVKRSDTDIDLTPKEFSLLEFFLRNKGEVLTRTFISEQVWGYNFDSMTNVIDVHINALRQKIDKGFKCPLLHTVRGVGYVLEARNTI